MVIHKKQKGEEHSARRGFIQRRHELLDCGVNTLKEAGQKKKKKQFGIEGHLLRVGDG